MRQKLLQKGTSILLSAAMAVSMIPAAPVLAAPGGLTEPEIKASDFANVPMTYRPGVRWWWPGGAAKTEDLVKQVEYLVENGFGAVEINPFNNGLYSDWAKEDLANILNYDNEEYYTKLKAVVDKADEAGITVDLNMGSGYCAADDSVQPEDTMGNMGLGRSTITVGADAVGKAQECEVPKVEVSALYFTELNSFAYQYCEPDGLEATWHDGAETLQAVIVSKIDSKEGDKIVGAGGGFGGSVAEKDRILNFYDPKTKEVTKSYDKQYILDPENTFVIPVSELKENKASFTPKVAGEYEVIGLYNEDSCSIGITALHYNKEKRDFVVDHLDPEAVANYVNGWIAGTKEYPSDLQTITDAYKDSDTLRAAFNDSYEFHNDNFYNDKVFAEASKENNILGYDFTKYLPIMYNIGSANFNLGTVVEPDDVSGTNADREKITYRTTENNPVTYKLTDDEIARITYDYHQLVDQAFQKGMESFSATLKKYGLVYRQQAYNPPIDTLKSSKYVDIPETEGLDEMQLKRVTSGAHLYGKNLITSEVYTLGSVPYTLTPSFIKEGYDLMATAGVTNFFYHGLNAPYYGTDAQKAAGTWGEEGWRAWPTIGIEMNETDALAKYYKTLNMYAARNNYVMQAGKQSADVAIYMPLFGSLSDCDTIATLNKEGYLYDAVNDDSIQNEFTTANGKLTAKTSGITYDALVVYTQSLPTATMESLQKLAASGANIIFYGDLPNKQPSYLDGAYAAADAKVGTTANAMVSGNANVVNVKDTTALTGALAKAVKPEITYASNANVRMNRRTLASGGEVAYIRNLDKDAANTVEVALASTLVNAYLLDQNTGKIYDADIVDGKITLNIKADASVILLAEPEGYGYAQVSGGTPEAIAYGEPTEKMTLKDFTLTVTADNIGTNVPKAAKETKEYKENALGDWSSDDVFGGALKFVSDEGVYRTSFAIADVKPYKYGVNKCILNLGKVGYAAEIIVNGRNLGQLVYAPYERDISSALKAGTNTLEIRVQGLRVNRRMGLKMAYETDKETYAKYEYYSRTVAAGGGATDAPAVMSAGLTGPVSLDLVRMYVSDEEQEAQKEAETAKNNEAEAKKQAQEAQAALEAAQKALQEAQKKLAEAQNQGSADVTKAQAAVQAAQKEAQAAKEAQQAAEKKLKDLQNENARMKFSAKKLTLKSVKAKKKSAKVTWKKITGANGYVIQYATNSKFKKAKKVTIKKGSTTSKTVSKLTGGKKYYVRVRAYKTIGGKKAYTSYSAVKKVTPKKK